VQTIWLACTIRLACLPCDILVVKTSMQIRILFRSGCVATTGYSDLAQLLLELPSSRVLVDNSLVDENFSQPIVCIKVLRLEMLAYLREVP
jgi:hypothetical protein